MKRLNAIRQAPTWQERLKLAENKKAVTEFDEVFEAAEIALKLIEFAEKTIGGNAGAELICKTADPGDLAHLISLTRPPLNESAAINLLGARQSLVRLGLEFAHMLRRGDGPHLLHELSKALSKRHGHKPNLSTAERIRVSLSARNGMFPPGKPRRIHGGKIVSDGVWSKDATRDVIESIERRGVTVNKKNLDIIRREIQKQAKLLNIPLDNTPGRPRTKTQKKS